MNGQGKLLTHYLKNADKLIIPVYQRNYDWREEHCKKLYQDLVRTIQNKKRWHFFGGIVSVSDPMGSSSDYLVIDGQQRITTVSLLLLAMANLIKDGKVVPEDDTLYAQITKKYLVDEINPKNRKVKLKPIKGDQDAYTRRKMSLKGLPRCLKIRKLQTKKEYSNIFWAVRRIPFSLIFVYLIRKQRKRSI